MILGRDWLDMCHRASKEVQRQDIEFKTLQDSKLAENHIVICGMVENIRHFVMPLRAEHLIDPSPIVILHDEELTSKQWQQLRYFTEIYFVKGSPLNESSYDRVNIMKAKQVVILTPNANKLHRKAEAPSDKKGHSRSEEFGMSKDEETLRDAKTIFKYNIIKKKNPKVKVVTELIAQDNIAFLMDNPLLYNLMKKYEYDQTPTFASGEVYLSSLMDSLICQAYYNPALPTVLKQLVVGENKKSKKRKGGWLNSGGFSSINELLGSNRLIADGDFSNIKTSNLYHLPVPDEFVDMPYSKLFSFLAKKRHIIPLGLYRTETVSYSSLDEDQNKATMRRRTIKSFVGAQSSFIDEGSEIRYVVTNPSKDLVIRATDVVFVLAQADPRHQAEWSLLEVDKGSVSQDPLDKQETMQPDKNNREEELLFSNETYKPQATGDEEDQAEVKGQNDHAQA